MRDRWRRKTPEQQAFVIGLGFVVVWFVGLLVIGVVTNVGGPEGEAGYVTGEPKRIGWPIYIVFGVLLGSFVAMAGYACFRLFRQRGVKYEDLDPEEQARREEAGRLLHDL